MKRRVIHLSFDTKFTYKELEKHFFTIQSSSETDIITPRLLQKCYINYSEHPQKPVEDLCKQGQCYYTRLAITQLKQIQQASRYQYHPSAYLGTCIYASKLNNLEERIFLSEDYTGIKFTASQRCHCREPNLVEISQDEDTDTNFFGILISTRLQGALKPSRSSSASWNK